MVPGTGFNAAVALPWLQACPSTGRPQWWIYRAATQPGGCRLSHPCRTQGCIGFAATGHPEPRFTQLGSGVLRWILFPSGRMLRPAGVHEQPGQQPARVLRAVSLGPVLVF